MGSSLPKKSDQGQGVPDDVEEDAPTTIALRLDSTPDAEALIEPVLPKPPPPPSMSKPPPPPTGARASQGRPPPPPPPSRRRSAPDLASSPKAAVEGPQPKGAAASSGDRVVRNPSEAPPPMPRAAEVASPSSQLPAICDFGRFELLGRLAFGGMAEIFLAREHSTEASASRHLVIKRILPHVATDSQFMDMFLDEARLAMNLNHPNICHIYEFGQQEGASFIAMEWVNGVTLGKLIRRARIDGGVPPPIAAKIAAQIAGALHYAHRAKDQAGKPLGIVHRDVSPHNVMISYDGAVKLLDFGIAKAASHSTKTEAGVIKGKFAYMSPEQCLGKDLDGRTDVFALGVCLFETLTGKQLFHQKTEYETMRAVIDGPVPSIRDVYPHLPEALDDICQKALQKDREARFKNAGKLQTALEQWFIESKNVVTDATLADYMEELYEEEIERGPLVDSTPFGQSMQRMSGNAERALEQAKQESHATTPSGPKAKAEAEPVVIEGGQTDGAKRKWLAVGAVALLALAVGVGVAMTGGDPPEPVASAEPAPTPEPVLEPAPEPIPEPAPEPIPEPAAPTTGSASVTSTPEGATVRLDGEEAPGETPLTLEELSPGEHAVELRRSGYEPFRADLTIIAGEVATLEASLTRAERAPTAPPGRLSVNTRPWSKVYVGRRLLGTTPIGEASVPSGTVRLRLVDRDGATHRRTVQVEAGETSRHFWNLSAP